MRFRFMCLATNIFTNLENIFFCTASNRDWLSLLICGGAVLIRTVPRTKVKAMPKESISEKSEYTRHFHLPYLSSTLRSYIIKECFMSFVHSYLLCTRPYLRTCWWCASWWTPAPWTSSPTVCTTTYPNRKTS